MSNFDRVLIVDSEKKTACYLANAARNFGFAAATATSFDEFVVKTIAFDPTVIFLDQSMPGKDGIEYLKALSQEDCAAQVVIVGAADNGVLQTITHLAQILSLHVVDSLPKPASIRAFIKILSKLTGVAASKDIPDIYSALEDGDVRPRFRPRATLKENGKWGVTSVDATLYWHIDESRVLPPEQYLRHFEAAGLLPRIVQSYVQQTVEQLESWSKAGHDFDATINIPAALLVDKKLPDQLQSTAQKSGVETARLTLEVSENDILEHSAEMIDVLTRLHTDGFRLGINRFGTGYSSIDQLFRMPFSDLKISPALVSSCEKNTSARAIVEAIVLLGQKLGKHVCADGVNSLATFECMSEFGCDSQQGYFVGRSNSAAALLDCATRWRPGAGASGSSSIARSSGNSNQQAASPQ